MDLTLSAGLTALKVRQQQHADIAGRGLVVVFGKDKRYIQQLYCCTPCSLQVLVAQTSNKNVLPLTLICAVQHDVAALQTHVQSLQAPRLAAGKAGAGAGAAGKAGAATAGSKAAGAAAGPPPGMAAAARRRTGELAAVAADKCEQETAVVHELLWCNVWDRQHHAFGACESHAA
jgi:hypothetical protein